MLCTTTEDSRSPAGHCWQNNGLLFIPLRHRLCSRHSGVFHTELYHITVRLSINYKEMWNSVWTKRLLHHGKLAQSYLIFCNFGNSGTSAMTGLCWRPPAPATLATTFRNARPAASQYFNDLDCNVMYRSWRNLKSRVSSGRIPVQVAAAVYNTLEVSTGTGWLLSTYRVTTAKDQTIDNWHTFLTAQEIK